MPPDTLPWDRFKERRYDRPPPPDGPSWRDPPPYHHGFRGRLCGNGRPVSWRYHAAESDHGFAASRVNNKFICDEGFRPSGYRMDGRYNGFNRDNEGPFVHRNVRGHARENGMSPNSLGRPHFGRDRRSLDDRGSFGQKDLFWETNRIQNGSDQRSLDEKASIRRRGLRGKSWENGLFTDSSVRLRNGNDPCSVDDKVPFEKKGLKKRSLEYWGFPNSGRPYISNDQRSLDDKRDLRGESSDNSVLLKNSSRLRVGRDQSSMDDKNIKERSVENAVLSNLSGKFDTCSVHIPVDDMLTFASPTHSHLARTHKRHFKDHCDKSSDGNDMIVFTCPTLSDLARTPDEHLKDQCDKSSGASNLASGRKLEKENSLGSIDWKPLKSRGSGFSHSSCAKITNSAKPETEMPPRDDTSLRSPSGDAAACGIVSAISSEEAGSRKKPRLGWGEGLAKFEKKKVEGPDDDSATKPELIVCATGEPSHVSYLDGEPSHVYSHVDRSPRVSGFDCVSPATPSFVACSSSPAVEDKVCSESENHDYDTAILSRSPNPVLQEHNEGNQEKREFCLENVELISVVNLPSSLTELVQLEDPAMVESSFLRSTAMNKLLMWRGEALKALEVTESEIDSLENDLKKLNSESESNFSFPATSSSLYGDCQAKPCEDSLENDLRKEHRQVRNEDFDSPTSKFVEPLSGVKDVVSSDSVKNATSFKIMDADVVENVEESPVYDSIGGDSVASLSSDTGETLSDRILASNKDTAIKAYEVFNKLLPSNHCSSHVSRIRSFSSWKDDPRIMDKFVFKKRCRRFEERVNTLKYKALQHLWKQYLQLMSFKNNRPKSQKRLETSTRGPHGSNQKNRSSFCSRFSNAAGNLSLVPTAEAINFMSKLLSNSPAKLYRNFLKLPALIVDKERKSRFISNNGLVEDPYAVEKEREMINPWTKEEKKIFMDRLATFGKNFSKICLYLDHKTIADCVEFYYKNHKSDGFVKLRKKPDYAKQGKSYSINNYLVASGKRLNRVKNAASLDVLGEASEIAANADPVMKTRQENRDSKALEIDDYVEERETEAANVLAGICGSISSEAMSSCITSSFDRGESCKELTNQWVDSDEESCSDDSRGEIEPSHWTDEEKFSLIQAVASCGNDFAMISRRVGTKSMDQCRVFYCKARKRLGLDTIRVLPCGEEENSNNGGGSDNEGACFVSSEKSSSKGGKEVFFDVDLNNLNKNDCKYYDELGKMIVDRLTGESKPEIGLEGDLYIENGVDNEPAMVSNPMGASVLHPDMIEDRGHWEALLPVRSESSDAAKDRGFPVPCVEVGTVNPGELQAEAHKMLSENNSSDKEDENSSNDKQKASRNGLRDLNCVDRGLHDCVNALDIGSLDAIK